MKDKLVTGVLLLALVAMAGSVIAAPNMAGGQLGTPGTQRTLTLPPAADHSSVISLGTAIDPTSGKLVEGYAIVHFAKGGNGGGKGKPPGGGKPSSCYAFMAKGAKWKTVEPWLLNPENNGGLPWDVGYPVNNTPPSPSFAFWNLGMDIDKWEDAANGVMNDGSSIDILGDGTETFATLVADMDAPDGLNEVYFADISSPGAIGVTIVWGIFGGPPQGRELVEWDQIYDDFDYEWSTSGEAGKMDFENIATHELGHSIGLSDLYDTACEEQTMYGYANAGETKKHTLESGDIEGAAKLY